MTQKSIHLNLFVHGRGHHEAGWRHPRATRLPLTDIRYYESLAKKAEEGKFDSIFFADGLALNEGIGHVAGGALEPLTTVAAMAAATRHIGFIATASTTYYEPFNLARLFASLDHITNGRVGWNIVTSWVRGANQNFGIDIQPLHEQRYDRAYDFVDAVLKLWDSWAEDAIVDDLQQAVYARTDRIAAVNHAGKHVKVAGPLNIARGPQGRPVLVQAGSSATGIRFAARHAEAVFTAHLEKSTATAFYTELKAAARQAGRSPEQVVVLPGISPVIGSTDEEALRTWNELNELTDPQVGLTRLSDRFGGFDFSHLDLDHVLTLKDFPDPATVQAAKSRAVVITGLVARERLTLRQLLHRLAGARGHFTLAGSPQRIADTIEDWVRSGAADGFNVMPPVLPGHLDDFVEHVVPILQKKGLFRREYESSTLRGHYGLDAVPSRWTQNVGQGVAIAV
jgi:FMN-dependent oxidoreductase (nitrilotriacetate monooxygenase family)